MKRERSCAYEAIPSVARGGRLIGVEPGAKSGVTLVERLARKSESRKSIRVCDNSVEHDLSLQDKPPNKVLELVVKQLPSSGAICSCPQARTICSVSDDMPEIVKVEHIVHF